MLRAVLYMCIAAILFPLLNSSVKYLGQHYPLPEVFWARYAGHVIYCLVAFLPRYGRSLFVSRRPGVQLMRAILLFAASACYFLGLRTVELPTASAITFVGPIIVTALAVPMLGERVGLRRWTAVMFGFFGALVIIRPGLQVMQWGAILVLLDALFYALYQLLSRKIGSQDPAAVSITLAGVGGVVFSTFLLPFSEIRMPTGWVDIAVFSFLGLWGLLGHYFVVKAYQWGNAAVVAPVAYLELVGATFIGWMLFRDFPDVWTWVGAAIIMASGLYIIYREHRLQRLSHQAPA